MSESLKGRFKDEVATIKGYVDYIENNFYSRSYFLLQTQGFGDFKSIKDYVFFTDDVVEKENNKIILANLIELVKSKIDACIVWLENIEKMELSEISKRILDSDLADSLCEYTRLHVSDCMNNPKELPNSKLIEELTATQLKKWLILLMSRRIINAMICWKLQIMKVFWIT